MKCQCGGLLRPDYTNHYKSLARLAGPEPNHKKKRIQKKLMKKWSRRMATVIVIQPLSRTLRCSSCKKQQGFYQAIAHNIFKVEPLPPGAAAIYTKDLDEVS